MLDKANVEIEGFVKVWDPVTGEIIQQGHNAINKEAMSYVLASLLQGPSGSYLYEMHFGNGGTIVDETGNITYRDVEINLEDGLSAGLYNPTYFKVIDSTDELNDDSTKNKVEIAHTQGLYYTDVVVTCTLSPEQPDAADYGNLVSLTQDEIDQGSLTGNFVFNELGLKVKGDDLNTGFLVSHIVFHPVQKSANRTIQVVYTLRIRLS
jgi:hypothetical protein